MRWWFGALLVFGAGALGVVRAAQTPTSLPGCVYNTSLPTLFTGQTTVLQCSSSGQLLLH